MIRRCGWIPHTCPLLVFMSTRFSDSQRVTENKSNLFSSLLFINAAIMWCNAVRRASPTANLKLHTGLLNPGAQTCDAKLQPAEFFKTPWLNHRRVTTERFSTHEHDISLPCEKSERYISSAAELNDKLYILRGNRSAASHDWPTDTSPSKTANRAEERVNLPKY